MYPALLGTLSSLLMMSDSVRDISLIVMLFVLFFCHISWALGFFSIDFSPPVAYNKDSKGLLYELALRPTVDDLVHRQRLFLCS